MSPKVYAANGCMILSCVAVPVLIYFALLCGAHSPMIEIPKANKSGAAVGCWIAAALYVGAGVGSWWILQYENKITT